MKEWDRRDVMESTSEDTPEEQINMEGYTKHHVTMLQLLHIHTYIHNTHTNSVYLNQKLKLPLISIEGE